jgi:L,D-transpeptidase catalytic domain
VRPQHARRWAFALLLAPLVLPVPANAGTAPRVPGSQRMSNEVTSTHWAYAKRAAPIRRLPSPTARTVARVRELTEDGFPEVYIVLRRWHGPYGHTWLNVRIPMRPNGQRGWVRASALDRLRHVRTRLVVDRGRLRATLFRSGRRIWRSSIGVGAAGTPTPAGRFWIRERLQVQDPHGIYGPWAFGTSAYSILSDWPGGGVIGIHGTNEPSLIPGRPSHGCIRVPNPRISRLARLMPIGTPVRIV